MPNHVNEQFKVTHHRCDARLLAAAWRGGRAASQGDTGRPTRILHTKIPNGGVQRVPARWFATSVRRGAVVGVCVDGRVWGGSGGVVESTSRRAAGMKIVRAARSLQKL